MTENFLNFFEWSSAISARQTVSALMCWVYILLTPDVFKAIKTFSATYL